MKKLSVFLCAMVLVFGVVGIKNTAQASYWSLSPSGQVDVSGASHGDPVSVDLVFNYTGDVSSYFIALDVSFTLDLAEVTPVLNHNLDPAVLWGNPNPTPYYDFGGIATLLTGNLMRIAGGNFGGYNMWNMGANTIATLYMTLVNPVGPLDGSDITLNAQTDLMGIMLLDDTIIQFGGASGPDYGPVPIPSAVWLLGSAFIGLLGFRKKLSKEA